MMQLPRFLPTVVLSCSFVAAVPAAIPSAMAQEAAPSPANGAAAPAAVEVSKELREAVDNYWHYAKIGRYDLAVEAGNQVLQQKDNPVAIRQAFQDVARQHNDHDEIDRWLLRWQGVEALRDVTNQIVQVLGEGQRSKIQDPAYIEDNIKRLSGNARAYQLAVGRLRESGELAVPMMLDYLRDPNKREYHSGIRNALRDMGRQALNPLLAATEMKDNETLTAIATTLGQIGYEAVVPYLAKLANDPQGAASVRQAATQSLIAIGAGTPDKLNAAQLFQDLGEKFYYDNASIVADPRQPAAYVWYWDDTKGLQRKDVPPAIFNEIMAMRSNEYALKLDPNMADAVSLWLASNYKREAELPEGATDPTRLEGQPDAHYYGVAAGSRHLNSALGRSLRDRNAQVALPVIRSLQQIAGQSNMFNGDGAPLIQAMQYPDRRVRYEAAFALASALPQKGFAGQEQVVPLLAEAVSQTGKPNVLVMAPDDKLNGLLQTLRDAGYGADGASSPQVAINAAAALPAVDVILVSSDIKPTDVEQLFGLAGQSPRLARSAKLVITPSAASPYAARAVTDNLMNVTQASEGEALKTAIEQSRQRSGSLPLDEAAATEYALRGAELLGRLATSRGQVYDLSAAEETLLSSLNDARPDVVKGVGNALGALDSDRAQQALFIKANDAKTADDVKVSLFKSLATNAKFFGNRLESQQVDDLRKTVEAAENLDVRSASAEAFGALNVPANEAKDLIINQSRV